MALLLSGQVENSWTQAVYTYTPLPWVSILNIYNISLL
ncbi:hypothetical protein NXX19_27815 [Bacteroides ovatus]|nr:hypothetical protein [Bacteroides ovatus]